MSAFWKVFWSSGTIIAYALLVLLVVAMCSACATNPPAPSVVTHIEPPPPVVRVPVLIPCIEDRDIPKPPGTMEIDEKLTAWQLAVSVRKKLLEWSAYAAKSDSLLRGCAKPEPKT